MGALQGLDPERVCHIGSVSKRLAPALRLGWMLCPSWLTGELSFAKGLADGGTPVVEQLALADFIARGELDRHLRRMRLAYRRRREALAGALAASLPGVTLTGIPGGVHVLALCPASGGTPVRRGRALRAAAAAGVWAEGLASHRMLRGEGSPAGIVLGYANLSEPALARAVALLGAGDRLSRDRRTPTSSRCASRSAGSSKTR